MFWRKKKSEKIKQPKFWTPAVDTVTAVGREPDRKHRDSKKTWDFFLKKAEDS